MAVNFKHSTTYTPQKFCESLYQSCKNHSSSVMPNTRASFLNNCKNDIVNKVNNLNGTTYTYYHKILRYTAEETNIVVSRTTKKIQGTFSTLANKTNVCDKYGGGGTPVHTGSEAMAREAWQSGVFEKDDIWYSASPLTLPAIISTNVASNIATNLTSSFRMAYGLKTFLLTAIEETPIKIPTLADQLVGTLGTYLKAFEIKWDMQAKQISDALIAQWSSNSDYPKHVVAPAFTPLSPTPLAPINISFSVPTVSNPAGVFAY